MSNTNSGAPQRIFPMLAYDDAPAAIDFLHSAFGFEEKFRMQMPDGNIGHAEMTLNGGQVWLATTWKAGGLSSPKDLPAMPCQLFCEVEDVDAHYRQASAAGAVVVAEPENQPYGFRVYRAMDLEGHRWLFASPLAGAK
jgi:uncharacterized glyoxalase superfamily protein PhnB